MTQPDLAERELGTGFRLALVIFELDSGEIETDVLPPLHGTEAAQNKQCRYGACLIDERAEGKNQ